MLRPCPFCGRTDNAHFLVCEEGTDYPFRAMYDGKTWGDGIFAIPVKWWMHLPAPPKEKERKDGDGNV